jgi:hypothetical protein
MAALSLSVEEALSAKRKPEYWRDKQDVQSQGHAF